MEATQLNDFQQELTQEKNRDFRKTVLLQLVLLATVLLLEDLSRMFGWPIPVGGLKLLFFGLTGVYLYFLWDMLRNFTLRAWLIQGVFGLTTLAFLCLFLVDVMLGSSIAEYPDIRLACHTVLLGVQALVVGFALLHLLHGPQRDVDKLWGSACIFFMSGFVFGQLFFCVLLKDPMAFGHRLPDDYWGLFESLYLSLTALIGLDNNAYPDCSRLVRNIILLEGAWSQLYLVLLIGRLLSKEEPAAAAP
jgi:hypothetical protein